MVTVPLKPGPHWAVQTALTWPGLQVVGQPKVKGGLLGRLLLGQATANTRAANDNTAQLGSLT